MREKPKYLPPTLREKHRYIAFQLIGERPFRKDEVKKAIWEASLSTLGVLGSAKAKPWFIRFDEKSQTGIVRVDRKHVEELRFALTLVTEINGSRAIFRTLGVSGTIKRLKRKFLAEFGWR
ncbi:MULTISPECIES: ribonuclease P protein component 2 [unclassified Thermococcus]|uniref:ribonuclease P protein component 2 n=1 Tax=unclassified Thermococcus TaxID=2627626 RepID=UPI000186FB40|nr:MULTISPECIES: ribonuclease P protein component 2 [unclassified Thermococcus]EEB74706.1 Ribonuclease P protein component 2 [Thermococcus sp. AM4]NJE49450.1 ribonuclease P protein component 2 [Thermococcus sp. 9N3]